MFEVLFSEGIVMAFASTHLARMWSALLSMHRGQSDLAMSTPMMAIAHLKHDLSPVTWVTSVLVVLTYYEVQIAWPLIVIDWPLK